MSLAYRPPLTERVVNTAVKGLTTLLCKIHADPVKQLPTHGPLILVTNHVNFLETPIIYTQLQPRPLTGFVKAETWDNPLMGKLFSLWGAIPIRRGEADTSAFRGALAALKAGQILAIAPEGTRSNTGILQRGQPGMTVIALMSGAPLIPLAHYGHENYRQNFSHLHRADINMVIGKPFTLDPGGQKVTGTLRQAMTDEIMYQLAALLPPPYRGVYSDLSQATRRYLRFEDEKARLAG